MNVMSGMASVFLVLYDQLAWAAVFILIGMVFDFFDGLAARLLHVKSEMGKELDSLADMLTFGVAPALLAHMLLRAVLFGDMGGEITGLALYQQILLFSPLIIPAFSAYRLAKFNLDVRQTMSFIGMPTPANALFWVGLVLAYYRAPEVFSYFFGNVWVLVVCVIILSVLLICELPMFSLKLTNFSWKDNKQRYCFLGIVIVGFAIWNMAAVPFIIPLYILFSVIGALQATMQDR